MDGLIVLVIVIAVAVGGIRACEHDHQLRMKRIEQGCVLAPSK